MRFLGPIMVLFLAATVQLGCSSFSAERVDDKDDEMLSTEWNENDSRMTAEKMIKEMLGRPWLKDHMMEEGKKPIVLVADIENRTDEPYIDQVALTNDVATELINSRRVGFVDGGARKKILDEIQYHAGGAVSPKSAKRIGNQTGADYLLFGDISSFTQRLKGRMIRTYQVSLRLTHLETSEIRFMGTHKIKKKFKRSGGRI